MIDSRFFGCGTALITPFHDNGSLDEATFRALVKRQVSEGIDFLVPCGTTGEVPTLTREEKLQVVKASVEESGGKPVMAGAGGYNTAEIIHTIADYEKLGVQAILSVTPYYNRPSQDGMIAHYRAIAESTRLPIFIYSIQGRTGVNVEPATMAELSKIPNVIGTKEASGSLAQVASIRKRVDDDFVILSGDDSVTLPVISLGGHGVISTCSNQIPGPMAQMAKLAYAGDYAAARDIQKRFQFLMEFNFAEPNPQMVKASMHMMGLCGDTVRLPLVKAGEANRAKMRSILQEAGLL